MTYDKLIQKYIWKCKGPEITEFPEANDIGGGLVLSVD